MSKYFQMFSLFLALILQSQVSLAENIGRFNFLDDLEQSATVWTKEVTPSIQKLEPVDVDLTEHYREFAEDGQIKIYVGYGYEAWYDERTSTLYQMLRRLSSYYRLPLGRWSNDGADIRFQDLKSGIKFLITVGNERNEFMNAFSSYEVVMYSGHSRYGQGPAFGSFSNYFRMGTVFETIEVDTRNPYFLDEPILKTDKFPVRTVELDSDKYQYQYRGQKVEASYLSESSYTKIIPGYAVDWWKTVFLPKRQLFYFNSCKNIHYWRDSIRSRFADPNQKFVIGTDEDSTDGTKPDAVMIISLARSISNSRSILSDLNATKDQDCFTSY